MLLLLLLILLLLLLLLLPVFPPAFPCAPLPGTMSPATPPVTAASRLCRAATAAIVMLPSAERRLIASSPPPAAGAAAGAGAGAGAAVAGAAPIVGGATTGKTDAPAFAFTSSPPSLSLSLPFPPTLAIAPLVLPAGAMPGSQSSPATNTCQLMPLHASLPVRPLPAGSSDGGAEPQGAGAAVSSHGCSTTALALRRRRGST